MSNSSDSHVRSLFADRIGGEEYGLSNEIYKFEKIKRARQAAERENPDRLLINLGVGENDEMAAPSVRAALTHEASQPENRGYADNGIDEFKAAAASFMSAAYGVDIDPDSEVNHSIGSKPALAMLPMAFINPGDVTLMTVPGYPVAGTHTAYLGGEVHKMPLLAENGFLPDLESIPADILKRAKMMVLNYPNSPTGAIATEGWFKDVIEFALQNKITIVHDAAHGLLSFEQAPLSFLAVDGAREVGVEVHSLSKGFNMIGWRIGWVCGNSTVISAFADIKDNSDSGQFIPIQKAAAVALGDASIYQDVQVKYRRRLGKLVTVLNEAGFDCKMPGGTYFLYAKSPTGAGDSVNFASAEDATNHLISEAGILTVPWDDAGSFLRFSATYDANGESEEDELMKLLGTRLTALGLRF
ncbi:MAG: LL-diaminopimelate aminotransferase [Chloroflexi bacterium]|nr:LL-diaminopimelate aminotransferase [Chloroflexota bacterium]